MADPDDYESLPASTPFTVVAAAGSLAGIAEHCAMFPVDSVKTRMQALSCDKQSKMGMTRQMMTMISEEGLFRPIRGVTAMMAGAGPAHAMYFGCLETGKNMASRANIPLHIGDGVSAVFATMLHDAVMTPAEVVKQRMQMCCSPYTSAIACSRAVFNSEGLRAFYRAYPTALSMNIPFQASMVVTYGLVQRSTNPQKDYRPGIHFLAGAIAGAVASAVTMPLDVCKTLLNTQEAGVLTATGQAEIRGLPNAARAVIALSGPTGFFRGLLPRILYQTPSTAISWSVYEFFKHHLNLGLDEAKDEDKYETLDERITNSSPPSSAASRFSHAQIGSRVSHLGNPNAATADTNFPVVVAASTASTH